MSDRKKIITPNFQPAATDYLYLLNRSYPQKETLKLICDRYRLNSIQRLMLYRGCTATSTATARKSKLTGNIKDNHLHIDGYNVIFTLMNYLLGKFLFLGNDHLLRDVGESYGTIEQDDLFYKAAGWLFQYLETSSAARVFIYLDSPVTNSALHKKNIETQVDQYNITATIGLESKVDEHLKTITTGILATADSEIIDAVSIPVIDLPRLILADRIRFLPDLAILTSQEK